jgi:hypothetical protein
MEWWISFSLLVLQAYCQKQINSRFNGDAFGSAMLFLTGNVHKDFLAVINNVGRLR